MSEIIFGGKVHVFPDGMDLQTIAKMLQSHKSPETPAGKPRVEGVGKSITWQNLQETPEQRRKAAETTAAILRQEAKATGDPLLQGLINQADAVSVAEDPYKAATSLKTYRRFLYGD